MYAFQNNGLIFNVEQRKIIKCLFCDFYKCDCTKIPLKLKNDLTYTSAKSLCKYLDCYFILNKRMSKLEKLE